MLRSPEERWEILKTLAADADEVLIATYNIYMGVDKNGNFVRSSKTRPARIFMNNVDAPTTKILVGVPPFYPCTENCSHCEVRRKDLIKRFESHQTVWSNAQIKFTKESHLKLYLFKIQEKWVGYTGGVNLSVSDWDDLLIEIPDAQIDQALEIFNNLWETRPEELDTLSYWSF